MPSDVYKDIHKKLRRYLMNDSQGKKHFEPRRIFVYD